MGLECSCVGFSSVRDLDCCKVDAVTDRRIGFESLVHNSLVRYTRRKFRGWGMVS